MARTYNGKLEVRELSVSFRDVEALNGLWSLVNKDKLRYLRVHGLFEGQYGGPERMIGYWVKDEESYAEAVDFFLEKLAELPGLEVLDLRFKRISLPFGVLKQILSSPSIRGLKRVYVDRSKKWLKKMPDGVTLEAELRGEGVEMLNVLWKGRPLSIFHHHQRQWA